MKKVLSIYSQYSYKQEAYLLGNKEGLIAVRDALTKAIEESQEGCKTNTLTKVVAHDGEDYSLVIICNRTPWGIDESWTMHNHYTADHASTEDLSGLKYPADLVDGE